MKIRVYVIDFETPRWLRRTIAWGVPLLAILGAASWVLASPTKFSAGQVLSHSALQTLNIATSGNARYSVGATLYCGQTTTTYSGQIDKTAGYAAAAAHCQTVSGCSATAHMCTSEELVRSTSMGIVTAQTPAGWYATGVSRMVGLDSNNNPLSAGDCAGYTDAPPQYQNSDFGSIWSSGVPSTQTCSNSSPILCCD